MIQGYYSLQAAAIAIGVEPNTLRAWESRYGVVEPRRSAAGHRRYSQEAVERLQRIASLVRKGHAISEVARLADDELRKLALGRIPVSTFLKPDRAIQTQIDRLFDAVRRYDLAAVARAVKWLKTAAGARSFVLDISVPLFDEIDKLVASSSLDVSEEHALSAVLRDQLGDLLHTLQALAAPCGANGKIVFACPEDDLHEFGILLGAVLAVARGLDVIYAGPNLPVAALVRVVKSCGARKIILGNAPIPPAERRVCFASYLAALDDLIPAQVEVLVGGEGDRPIRAFASGRPLRYLSSLDELEDVWAAIAESSATEES